MQAGAHHRRFISRFGTLKTLWTISGSGRLARGVKRPSEPGRRTMSMMNKRVQVKTRHPGRRKRGGTRKTSGAGVRPKAAFFDDIRDLIVGALATVARRVDLIQVQTNFEIGRCIVREERLGEDRAAYGKEVIKALAERLTSVFGFSASCPCSSKTRPSCAPSGATPIHAPSFCKVWPRRASAGTR
jgi:hypothetical protein